MIQTKRFASLKNSVLALLFLPGCLLVLGACSSGHSGSSPAAQVTPTSAGVPELDALGLAPIMCMSPHCPQAVGQLVTNTYRGLRLCTASLVRPDVILTASHCVPWETVSPKEEIDGNCWFRTPQGSARCKGVVEASHLSTGNEAEVESDFAYIRLETPLTSQPFAVVNDWGQGSPNPATSADPASGPVRIPPRPRTSPKARDQASSQERYLDAAIDTQAFSGVAIPARHQVRPPPEGSQRLWVARTSKTANVIRSLDCHPEPNAQLADKKWTPDIARIFSACEVSPGDSGGPLVDSRGRVLGVISLRQASAGNANDLLTVVTHPQMLNDAGN